MIWTITILWWNCAVYCTLGLIGLVNQAYDGAVFCFAVAAVCGALGKLMFNKQKGSKRA